MTHDVPGGKARHCINPILSFSSETEGLFPPRSHGAPELAFEIPCICHNHLCNFRLPPKLLKEGRDCCSGKVGGV